MADTIMAQAPAAAANENQASESSEAPAGEATETQAAPIVAKKPSLAEEFSEKFANASPDDIEALVRSALKKNPIKTKSGKDEFVVDDFDRVKRAVSLDRHFDKIGKQYKDEREALESQKDQLQKLLSGDTGLVAKFLSSDPHLKATVSEMLYQQMQQEEQIKQMDPTQRAMTLENQRLKAEMQAVKEEQQKRHQEAQRHEESRLLASTKQELEQYFISGMEAVKAPPYLRERLARRMASNADASSAFGGPLGPEQLGQMALDEMREDAEFIFQGEGEDLLKSVGEKLASKIARAYVNRIKGQPQAAQQVSPMAPKPEQKRNGQADLNGELWKEMREKLGVGRWHK